MICHHHGHRVALLGDGICETVMFHRRKPKLSCECQVLPGCAVSRAFLVPYPGSWVLLHESAEILERETKAKRRIFQANFLEKEALSYDAKQE